MKMIKQKKYWSLMELLSHASSKTSFLHLKKVEDTFHWIYANTNVHSSHGKLHNQHHYRKHHWTSIDSSPWNIHCYVGSERALSFPDCNHNSAEGTDGLQITRRAERDTHLSAMHYTEMPSEKSSSRYLHCTTCWKDWQKLGRRETVG